MRFILSIISFLTLTGCTGNNPEKIIKRSHPSHIYKYIDIDKSDLEYLETDYVPIYSDIFWIYLGLYSGFRMSLNDVGCKIRRALRQEITCCQGK